jgi:hypothetical protein
MEKKRKRSGKEAEKKRKESSKEAEKSGEERKLNDAKRKRSNTGAYSWFASALPDCFVMLCVGVLYYGARASLNPRHTHFVPR